MKLRKITGLALSAIMAASQIMPVMAADPTPATGNVLAYQNETVTVPTAIKVSFNPAGYDVTVRADVDAQGALSNAVTSNSQIVSLNYGFASDATMDKIASVSLEATLSAAEDGQITFVDNAEDATTNAEAGELKMYLAVATNDAAITKSNLKKDANDGTISVGATTFALIEDTTDTNTKHTTHKKQISNADPALLADVDMTAATAENVAFVADGAKATAAVNLKLGKAVYQVHPDEVVDFGTTQTDLAAKMELKTLGGIEGFTITGAMNTDADWTKANVTAIAITPTFEYDTEATEDDEVLAGTHAQVEAVTAGPKLAIDTTAGTITMSDLTAEKNYKTAKLTIDGADYVLDQDKQVTFDTSAWSSSTGGTVVITLKTAWTSYVAGKNVTVTLTLSDDTTISKTKAFPSN